MSAFSSATLRNPVAKLLYLLGKFSVKRAWLVLVAWVLILGGSAAAAFTLGGSFSSNFSLTGTPAQQVIDNLKQNFPEASRGGAQIVFHKTDGTPFTEAEKAAIAADLERAAAVSGVEDVVNPFATQTEKDDGAQQLADAQAKVDAAPKEFADGQAKIDDGRAQLNAGLAQIASGEAQAASGRQQLNAAQAELTEGRSQVDAALAQLALAPVTPETTAQIAALQAKQQELIAAQATLDQQRAQLNASLQQLASAKATAEASRGELVSAQATLDQAKANLPGQIEKLGWGQALLSAAENYRTVSADGQTAIAMVLFEKPLGEVSPAEKDAVVEAIPQGGIDNVQVEYSKDLVQNIEGLLGPGEAIGLIIAVIVLVIMLGSIIAAGLPLITALIGVAVSGLVTVALAGFIEMNSTTPVLGVMLGLAVGIDYSLFILNRHRKQLKDGMDVRTSIALANGTSGSAVFFAGLTVIIALLALNLTGVDFLGLMGTIAAVSIVIAVLAAVTFTPAIASLLGMRVLSRRERRRLAASPETETLAHDHVSLAADAAPDAEAPENVPTPKHDREVWAAKRPVWASLVAIAVLAVVAIPLGSMRLGLPDGSSEPVDSTQYRAYTLTEEGFGEGANGLITTVVTLPDAPEGDDLTEVQASLATELMSVENVDAVVVGAVSDNGRSILFAVQPSEGPASQSTEQVVRDLRALEPTLASEYDAEIGVTGVAAVNIDISKKLADALPLYLAAVIGLSLLLLILVFRSLLLPIVASVGFLLTVLASLGAVVAVYQLGFMGALFDVHDPGPILSFLPTLLIGILFGLAMDYQLFIATGIREAYVHGDTARRAITHGVKAGRSVVIAAAIIMVSVFGSFAFGHLTVTRPLGFGLAVGILFDAFLVRLLFVPAMLRLFGDKAWWMPRWLDKIMPDMDVEGAKLERGHAGSAAAQSSALELKPSIAKPEPVRVSPASVTTGSQHVVRPKVKTIDPNHHTPTPTE